MLLIGFDKISEPSLRKRPEGLFTAATLETIGLFIFFFNPDFCYRCQMKSITENGMSRILHYRVNIC